LGVKLLCEHGKASEHNFLSGGAFRKAKYEIRRRRESPPSAAPGRSGIFQEIVSSRVVKIHNIKTAQLGGFD